MVDNVERSTPNARPRARLLVVDDEKPLVAAMCHTLSAAGYETQGVYSGSQALGALRAAARDGAAPFDVLITDLMMPDTNGIALLCAAQQIEPHLVSIVMTGHGAIDTAIDALKSGALDYILKPFNLTVVMPVLSRALAVRRLRSDNTALLQRVAERTAELETANRELRGANEELEAFTSSVAHDLRQPLNGLMGFSELLLDEQPGALNPTQKEYLREIRAGAHHLMQLTDDWLRFSRLGQQPLRKEMVRVADLVWEVARQCRQAEPNRSVDLHIGALPNVQADPALLEQVFTNLVANAFKFTRGVAHPVIQIEGHEQDSERTYSIRDNGVGFDMEKAQGSFSIFHRLRSHEDFEGSGVGLSIVQRIVERHGGRVSVRAQIGKGAEFTLTLPA
jgi:signal transduction histidine kinase